LCGANGARLERRFTSSEKRIKKLAADAEAKAESFGSIQDREHTTNCGFAGRLQ
jgi:hypothetical protein